ncbi:MAG: hypothetical protein M3Z22_04895, partial [Verrucomicrobiota bacterium]|nr:hypothetical protein [Verrucomicrobiota bacterium]
MTDVKRFLWPILVAVPALAAGIAIGHYSSPAPPILSTAAAPASSSSTPVTPSIPGAPTSTTSSDSNISETDTLDSSSENIIARIKGALGRPSNRRTYATFS